MLVHDAGVSEARTHATDVAAALADLKISMSPHDQIFLVGPAVRPGHAHFLAPTLPDQPHIRAWLAELRRPVRLALKRAVLISVQDASIPISFYTTARTVGEALV